MNYEELKEARKALQELQTFSEVSNSPIAVAIKAIDAQLAGMKDDVWIPPDQELVIVTGPAGADLIRVSSGELTPDNCLMCYFEGKYSGNTSSWDEWHPIPNMVQLTPHDGSDACPCRDETIWYMQGATHIYATRNPQTLRWRDVDRWAYVKDSTWEK